MLNYIEYLVLAVALLLVAAIWLLSSVLMMLSKKVVEMSKQNKTTTLLLIAILSGIINPLIAQEANTASEGATEVVATTAYYGSLSALSFWTLTTVLGLELLIIFVLLYFIRNLWRILNPVPVKLTVDGKKAPSWIKTTWANLDKRFFTKAAPIEQEADILLDHDYDGIRELDNASSNITTVFSSTFSFIDAK
jgi:cytochrome c oxidase cbb3-type subunit 3